MRWAVAIAVGVAVAVALVAPVRAAPLVPLPSRSAIHIRYEPGLEDVAEDLQQTGDAALAEIHEDLPDLPAPRVIEVQLVRDASSLAEVAPPGHGAPPWAIGVAYPDLGVVSVAIRRGAQLVDPGSTLRHELAHIALGAALGERAPHWLHEGFAYQHSAEPSWDRNETLAGMAWFGSVIPLEDIDRSFPAQELPADRAYAEAYDFVGFLARRGRYEDPDDDGNRWPFRKFLSDIGHGATLDAAAIHAYGRPLHDLFDEWKTDLSKRFMFAPIGLIGLALWVLCALLLALAYWRRRRSNRRRLAQWDREERAADDDSVHAPPYVPWPGEDPFAEDEDDDPPHDPN
jgi:hypothetical protein